MGSVPALWFWLGKHPMFWGLRKNKYVYVYIYIILQGKAALFGGSDCAQP